MQHFNTFRSWSYLHVLEQIDKPKIQKELKRIAQNKCIHFVIDVDVRCHINPTKFKEALYRVLVENRVEQSIANVF